MRAPHLAAFLATVAIAVPAGWHALEADIQTDGPALRPALSTIQIGSATVTVQLDRGVMVPGGTINAVIVATSDTPQDLSLDVRALQDNGYGGERVPNPPTVIGKQRIKVHAAPGGGAASQVAFKLGKRKPGRVEWFDIDVMASTTKFRGQQWEMVEDDKPDPRRAKYGDDGDEGGPANAARVSVAVWGGNSIPLHFEPTAMPAKGPFEVAFTVKNTTKKALEYVDAALGDDLANAGLDSGLMVGTSFGDDGPYRIERIGDSPDGLEAGEARTYKFRVTPRDEKQTKFTLAARLDGGRQAGALDVMTFERPASDTPPTIAAVTK